MSERAREPLFFEEVEEEPEPEPSTESAGSGGMRTAIGSDLGDSGGEDEPPIERGPARGNDPGGEGSTLERSVVTAVKLLFQVHSLPIENLNLSIRLRNCLRKNGLFTVGHLLRKSEQELRALRNFTPSYYDELRDGLDEIGIAPRNAPWDTARRVN